MRSKLSFLSVLLVLALGASGALASDTKCGGDKNSTKTTKCGAGKCGSGK